MKRNFFLLNKEIRAGLNFIALNRKVSQIIGDIIVYNLCKCQIDTNKNETSTNFFIPQKFYLLMGSPGLNFNAINLKFSPIIGDIGKICDNFRLIAHKLISPQTFFSHKQSNDSSVSKVPASHDLPVFGNRQVATLQYFGNRRVMTLPYFGNQQVVN